MPLKLGAAPIRRTQKFLEAGKLVFKDRVKVMTINYCEDEFELKKSREHPGVVDFVKDREFFAKPGKSNQGALDFVFWNVPQIQYKNPNVQIVMQKNTSPTPYITCYLDDGRKVYFDVDHHTSSEIIDRLIKVLGKSEATLEAERLASEKKQNPANFGLNFDRWCICSVPGQLPCPGLIPLPKHWRGKYHFGKAQDEE